MMTPATKRRRVAVASTTLKKPFKSPLVAKGVHRSQPTTEGSDAKHESGDGIEEIKSSPARVHKQPINPNYCATSCKTTTQHGDSTTNITSPTKATASGVERTTAAETGKDVAAWPASMLQWQKTIGKDLKRLEDECDKVRQAHKILDDAAARETPDGSIQLCAELDKLTLKWRGAARIAAEELFPTAKQRFFDLGGSKGMRQMRERQAAFFANYDKQQNAQNDETQEQDVDEQLKEDEEDYKEFTMGAMLKSMNIELDLMGYLESEDRWTDD